jgi:hypothetical protein
MHYSGNQSTWPHTLNIRELDTARYIRVIHESSQWAQCALRLEHKRFGLGWIGDVATQRHGSNPQLYGILNRLLGLHLGARIVDGHVCTHACERQGDFPTRPVPPPVIRTVQPLSAKI